MFRPRKTAGTAVVSAIRIAAAVGVFFALPSLKISLALRIAGGAVLSMPITWMVGGALLLKTSMIALQAGCALGSLALVLKGALIGYVGYHLIDRSCGRILSSHVEVGLLELYFLQPLRKKFG